MLHSGATSKKLQALIASCKDSEYDFKLFAKHTPDEALREHYLALASRCHRTAKELQVHLSDGGSTAQLHGSAWGLVHRGWLRLLAGYRSTRRGKNWLPNCNRTEIKLLNQMRRTVKDHELPEPVQDQVSRYIHAWQHIHGQMRQLRKTHKADRDQTDSLHAEET